MMKDDFKCQNMDCNWRKKKYNSNITHVFGIFHRGKLYCITCAKKLKLFEIKVSKPEIVFK